MVSVLFMIIAKLYLELLDTSMVNVLTSVLMV